MSRGGFPTVSLFVAHVTIYKNKFEYDRDDLIYIEYTPFWSRSALIYLLCLYYVYYSLFTLQMQSTSAFSSINNFTVLLCPFCAAWYSGVH